MDVALNIAGVERIHSENLRLPSALEPICFNEKSVNSVVGDFQISLAYSI